VVEGHLRPVAGECQAVLADRLADCCAAVLAEQRDPAAIGPETVTEIRGRLHRAQLAEPQSVADIAWTSAARLFDALPIHDRLRRPDREAVMASVRFMMVSRCGRLERRLDRGELVQALLAGA
jgi:hypothetical protein